jgi:hypothetical protein
MTPAGEEPNRPTGRGWMGTYNHTGQVFSDLELLGNTASYLVLDHFVLELLPSAYRAGLPPKPYLGRT